MPEVEVIETQTAPLTGRHWSAGVPHLRGGPMPFEAQARLFHFLTGEPFIDMTPRLEQIPKEQRPALQREIDKARARVTQIAAAWSASVAVMLDLPSDVLALRLPTGELLDRRSLDVRGIEMALPVSGMPPRLVE